MTALSAAVSRSFGLSLLAEELRRIVRMPLLVALPFAFLVLNGALIFGNSWLFPHMVEIASVAQQVGVRVDQEFLDAVAVRPPSGARDQLAFSVSHAQGIVAAFDAGEAAAAAASDMDTSLASRLMASKYTVWESRVDAVRASGQEWDVYGATYTFEVHQFLFGTLVPAVILEASSLGIAVLLVMSELDERTGARSIVLSSPVGRGVVTTRLAASLMWALAMYAVLAALTFGAVAALSGWGTGIAWESSVSSLFNVVVDGGSARPFVTWSDCSVGTYLIWSLLLGLGFMVLLCLAVQVVLLATCCSAVRAAVTACVLDGAVGDTSGLRAQRVAYRPCAHARLSSAPACRERPVVYRPGASLVHSMAGSCSCDLWHRCPVVHAPGAESHVVR